MMEVEVRDGQTRVMSDKFSAATIERQRFYKVLW